MLTIKTKILTLLSLLGLLFFASSCRVKDNPSSITFKPDGTQFYVIESKRPAILEYRLPDSWNIGSAEFTTALDVSAQTSTPERIAIISDGTTLWLTERASAQVFEYGMSTPWKLSSASFLR